MKLHVNVIAVASTLFLVAAATGASATEIVVSTGAFHGGPHAPNDTASGGVILVHLDSGKYELRFGNDFKSVAGPDLFIYLSAAEDPKDDATVAASAFVDAGALKALSGGQSYMLPADFDPGKFKSVTVWCKRYSVLFAAAPLNGQ